MSPLGWLRHYLFGDNSLPTPEIPTLPVDDEVARRHEFACESLKHSADELTMAVTVPVEEDG